MKKEAEVGLVESLGRFIAGKCVESGETLGSAMASVATVLSMMAVSGKDDAAGKQMLRRLGDGFHAAADAYKNGSFEGLVAAYDDKSN